MGSNMGSTRARVRRVAAALSVGVTLTAGVVAVTTTGADARAADATEVSVSDPRGDVIMRKKPNPPTRGQKRSVDITGFAIVPLETATRFVFDIAAFTHSQDFDQTLYIAFGRGSVNGRVLVFDTTKTKQVVAGYDAPGTSKECSDLRVKKAGRAGILKVDVPHSCLPAKRVELAASADLYASDVHKKSFAHDDVVVPGLVRLR